MIHINSLDSNILDLGDSEFGQSRSYMIMIQGLGGAGGEIRFGNAKSYVEFCQKHFGEDCLPWNHAKGYELIQNNTHYYLTEREYSLTWAYDTESDEFSGNTDTDLSFILNGDTVNV